MYRLRWRKKMLLSLFGLPQVVASLLQFATPFLSSLLGFLGWYFVNIWDGLKVILANLSTLVVLGTVAIGSGLYGAKAVNCDPVIKEVIKTIPEKVKEWDPFR